MPNKAEQMMSLTNGKGIQYLIDEGYKILGNPINVFNTDYNLIAYTDVQVDDFLWNELAATGTFSFDSQVFFMEECFTDVVANAEKLALMTSDRLKYDRILGHLYNSKGIKVANVLMLEVNNAFDPDTVAAFEILANLLTREISGDDFYVEYGAEWQNTLIRRLIACDIEERRLYSPHLQNIYAGFKANLFVAVVDISRSGSAHCGQKHFTDLFRRQRNDFKYSIYENYIVIIISTDYKVFKIKRELNGLSKFIEQENLYAGISSCFDNLFELHKYYAEGKKALSSLKPGDPRHIAVYKK